MVVVCFFVCLFNLLGLCSRGVTVASVLSRQVPVITIVFFSSLGHCDSRVLSFFVRLQRLFSWVNVTPSPPPPPPIFLVNTCITSYTCEMALNIKLQIL